MDCKEAKEFLERVLNEQRRPLVYGDYRELIREYISTLTQRVRGKNGQPGSKANRGLNEGELRQKILDPNTYHIQEKRGRPLIQAWVQAWLLFYYDLCLNLEKANALDEGKLKKTFAKSKGDVLEKVATPYKKEVEKVFEGLANWESLWQALLLYLKGGLPDPETSRELTLGFPLVAPSGTFLGYVHLVGGSQPRHLGAKLLPDPLALAYFPMTPKSLDAFKNILDFGKAFLHYPEISVCALVSQHGALDSGLCEGFSGAPTAAKAAVGHLVWASLKDTRGEEAEWVLLEGGSFGLSLFLALWFFPELGLNYVPHKLRLHKEIAFSGSLDLRYERLEPVTILRQKLELAGRLELKKLIIVASEPDYKLSEKHGSKVILLNPEQNSLADAKELFSQEIKGPIERFFEEQEKSLSLYPQMRLLTGREGNLDRVFEEPEVETLTSPWEGVEEAEGDAERVSRIFLSQGQARLRDVRRILLLGEQGSGKSTLAKWLALQLHKKGTPAVYVNLAWLRDVAQELEGQGQGELKAERLLAEFVRKKLAEKNVDISGAVLNGFIETHFVRGYGSAYESEGRAWLLLDSLERIEFDAKSRELFGVLYRDIKAWACNALFCARSSPWLEDSLRELEGEAKLEKKRQAPLKKEKVKSLLEKLLGREQGRRLYGLIQKDALLIEYLRWPINVLLFAAGFGGSEAPSFRKTLEHLIEGALGGVLAGSRSRGRNKEIISGVIRGLARSVWDSVGRKSDLTYSISRKDAREKIKEELLKDPSVLEEFTQGKGEENLVRFAGKIAERVLEGLEDEQTGPFFVPVDDATTPSLEFHSRQFFSYLLSFELAEKLKAGERSFWEKFKDSLDYPLIGEIAWFYASEQDLERERHVSELLKALSQRDRDDVFRHRLFLACQVLAARPEALDGREILESAAEYLLQQKVEVLHYLCPWDRFPFRNAPLLRPGSHMRKVLESELKKAREDREAREEVHLRALGAARLLLPVVEEKRKEILQVLRKGIQSQSSRVLEVSARIVGEFAEQIQDGTEELLALVKGLRCLVGEEGREWWVRVAAIWALGRLSEVVDPDRAEKGFLEELKEANRQMYSILCDENPDESLEFTALWALLRSRVYLESPFQKKKVGELLDIVLERWNEGSRRDRAWPNQAFLMLAVRTGRRLFWVSEDEYATAFVSNGKYVSLLGRAIEEKRTLLFEAAVQAYLQLRRYLGKQVYLQLCRYLGKENSVLELLEDPDSLREELRSEDRVRPLMSLLNGSEDWRVRFVAAELLGRPLILSAGLGQKLKDEYKDYRDRKNPRGPIRIEEMGEAGKIAREVVLALLTKLQTEERNSLLRPLGRSLCAWHEVGVRVYQAERTGEKEVFYLGRPPLKEVFGKADRDEDPKMGNP